MRKATIFLCGIVCITTVSAVASSVFASLQPGWQEAGWREDYDIALGQSRSLEKPAIIYFDAIWCSWCQQYKHDVLDRPKVKTYLKKHYIPIVVDFDSRPDLFDRFAGRGLPFTVILSPNGKVVNRFSGILDEKDFLEMLRENLRLTQQKAVSFPPIVETIRVQGLDQKNYVQFRESFLAHIDTLYSRETETLIGQYETGATLKRPSPRTWLYLMKHGLWQARSRKAIAAEQARLLDRQDGGFFNFVDPGRPEGDYLETSKLLEANAWLIAWFARASQDSSSAAVAADLGWYYLRDVLWDSKRGGFWQAQVANNKYYELSIPDRIKQTPPPVDKIKRADTNAQAAIALNQAGHDRKNGEMIRYAKNTFEFILDRLMQGKILFHVRSDANTSIAALPRDWFWLMLAGQKIDGESRTQEQRMNAVVRQAGAWLQGQMNKNPQPILSVELAGLIAQNSCGRKAYPQMPKSSCAWALRQMRIEPETPPDDIISGLLAWEATLGY